MIMFTTDLSLDLSKKRRMTILSPRKRFYRLNSILLYYNLSVEMARKID